MAEKRKPGRPTKLTPELQDEICGYIAQGMTYADACRLGNISHTIFQNWRKYGENGKTEPYVSFLEAVTRANAEFKQAVHASIMGATRTGDWQAGLALAKCRFPEEYSPNRVPQQHEHSGSVGQEHSGGLDVAHSGKVDNRVVFEFHRPGGAVEYRHQVGDDPPDDEGEEAGSDG